MSKNVVRIATACLAVATSTIAACSSPLAPTDRVCAADFRFGLIVRVQDSVTGAWIGSGSTAIAVDQRGATDSVSIPADNPALDSFALPLAGEHDGTFTVTVRHAGYRDWTQANVRVTRNECHVNPVSLTARMQPLQAE